MAVEEDGRRNESTREEEGKNGKRPRRRIYEQKGNKVIETLRS